MPEQTAIISMNQCNLKNAGDSEESLTSDMEHSKPSSIIGTSSKANSDIDMGEEHKTMMNLPRADFELNRKSVVDAQRDRRPTADDEKTPIVVARPVDESQSSASLATRGKLRRSPFSFCEDEPAYSFVSQNSFELMPEFDLTDDSEDIDDCMRCLHYLHCAMSPPPLSNLQIFAISKKPEDIQVQTALGSIPSDIEYLPSLPIISRSHSERSVLDNKKLSILEPPPPGLVSRRESNENWNQFLINLNSILESRAEEFV